MCEEEERTQELWRVAIGSLTKVRIMRINLIEDQKLLLLQVTKGSGSKGFLQTRIWQEYRGGEGNLKQVMKI